MPDLDERLTVCGTCGARYDRVRFAHACMPDPVDVVRRREETRAKEAPAPNDRPGYFCPCQHPTCERHHDDRALLLALLTRFDRLEKALKAHGVGSWVEKA